MASKQDYYKILNVEKNAADDEIKKAYRKLAKKYHPDLNAENKQAEAKFKEVNEAYEVLSNKEKRTRYDQFGHDGVNSSYGGGSYSSGNPFGQDIDLSDIFNSFFGGFSGSRTRNQNYARHGTDVETAINISFEEAAKGCTKRIIYDNIEQCGKCGGSGCKNGASPKSCNRCHGTGQVTISQKTPFGVMQTSMTCDSCGGQGKVIDDPCLTCAGKGRVRNRKDIEINVPAGINNEQILNVRGKGNAGTNGGQNGDLHVYVSIKPHTIFERKGDDVWCEVPITFTQAALGCTIAVPTLDGNVEYDIHEGTQPGDVFKLRGKGVTKIHGRGGRGDQYVKISIEIPRNLTENQKKLFKTLEDSVSDKNYQKRKSFFDKIKSIFGN